MQFIPVNEPLLDGNEKEYVLDCINTGWISSEGPYVTKFENDMASKVGRKFGIAVCNGTAALEIAVASLEFEKGSEIILPSFAIISCAAAVIRCGCVPVLVDIDPYTLNLDVSQIEAKVTPKTKCIMIVHTYWLPVDVEPVLLIARKHGLKIIEDAAEMHGQTYKGRPCGSFGDISIFSFYANKHITTGEGGMLLTDDEYLAMRSRSLRNLCFNNKNRFVHEELGYNFRMTNLQAALGLAQLERLDEHIARKKFMGKYYNERLQNIKDIQLPLTQTSYAENIYWVYGIILKQEAGIDANKMMNYLADNNIGCRPFFWPLHEQPIFKKMGLFQNESYPISERVARFGFYIPSGIALTIEQMDIVIKKIHKIIKILEQNR